MCQVLNNQTLGKYYCVSCKIAFRMVISKQCTIKTADASCCIKWLLIICCLSITHQTKFPELNG